MEATVDTNDGPHPKTSQHEPDAPIHLPYPLGPQAVDLWLRRGQRMGLALPWTAMAIAALSARGSAAWRRMARLHSALLHLLSRHRQHD
jgi:hypothetical protein